MKICVAILSIIGDSMWLIFERLDIYLCSCINNNYYRKRVGPQNFWSWCGFKNNTNDKIYPPYETFISNVIIQNNQKQHKYIIDGSCVIVVLYSGSCFEIWLALCLLPLDPAFSCTLGTTAFLVAKPLGQHVFTLSTIS